MANEVIITSECKACLGTGVNRYETSPGQWVEDDCELCLATGYVSGSDGVSNVNAKISAPPFQLAPQ